MSVFIFCPLSWVVGCACNRTRPAPMSGGTAVQTERHGKGAGAGAAEPRAMAFARSTSEGLGLDGGRGRRPSKRKEKEFSPSGLSDDAQGIEAEWPRQLAGSVHESPIQRDAPIYLIWYFRRLCTKAGFDPSRILTITSLILGFSIDPDSYENL